MLDGGRITGRFRELEVEIGEDAPAELARRARRAAAARPAPGTPDPTPKIVRALGPRALAPPDVVPPGRPRADGPRRRGAGRDRASVHAAPRPRSGRPPRRRPRGGASGARSRPGGCAPTCERSGSLLDPEWAEALRDELRWLGAELGAVRDTEVLLDLLRRTSRASSPSRRSTPSPSDLSPAGAPVGRPAASSCSPRMRSTRYAELLDRLVDGCTEPALLPETADARGRLAPAAGRGPWRHLRDARRRARRRTRRTRRCTRSGSGPSAAVTPPRQWRPSSASRRRAVRPRRRRSPGSARRASGRGRRRHSGCATARAHRRRRRGVRRRRARRDRARPTSTSLRDEWPAVWQRGKRKRLRALAVSRMDGPPQGARRRRRGVAAGPRRRRRGARWCTGLATTTGASRRARAIRARPTRRPRAGRSTRRPGCTLRARDRLPAVRYEDRRGRPKVVRYWLMRPDSSDRRPFVPNDEVDELRWCSADEARKQLDLPARP